MLIYEDTKERYEVIFSQVTVSRSDTLSVSAHWLAAKEGGELSDQSGAGQPGGSGDDVSIDNDFVVGTFNILTAGKSDLRHHCGIASQSPLGHALGGKEKLRSMAHGSNWLSACNEALHALNNIGVGAEVLGSATTWDVESVVVLGVDFIEVAGHN